jgi:hypothetical protein
MLLLLGVANDHDVLLALAAEDLAEAWVLVCLVHIVDVVAEEPVLVVLQAELVKERLEGGLVFRRGARLMQRLDRAQ